MPRPRVLSFMSQWGGSSLPRTSSPVPVSPPASPIIRTESPPSYTPTTYGSPQNPSPKPPRAEGEKRSHSRSSSMVMAYQPPVMEIASDTPAELQPIFTYLNSHANKLYQEGYFLKLHDLDSRGRPSPDRAWTECFAQLVGTVLSLWDAAQLDAAGEDGEVMPTFINLTDASIRMIESLPMNGVDGQSLQNVLSISTAANNRYLLHFNSLHSLTQWTAGIRLAMYEYSTLQEAYTGSIIAGKGKKLNNIRTIMEKSRYPSEDWARVRFGAGTPWRRCWCVISQPDEKDLHRAQKLAKKRSAYEKAPVVKGEIKFYETKKVTKKTKPIATIKDAYTAYSIYPQSKHLIDQSTLVKVEGTIVIHSNPETVTEGFVFVMPEVHPAISGFEMMIRWLMPTFDTFALYGRPNRLIADVMDVRSLMFAMPSGYRYGYLDLIDVAGLIHTEGSINWTEREWRKQLKNLTSKRMSAPMSAPNRTLSSDLAFGHRGSRSSVNLPSPSSRSSLNLPTRNSLRFGSGVAKSSPSSRQESPVRNGTPLNSQHRNVSESALPQRENGMHQRAASEAYKPAHASRLSFETARYEEAPPPPPHQGGPLPPLHGIPASSQLGSRTMTSSPIQSNFIGRDRSPANGGHSNIYTDESPTPPEAEYSQVNGYSHGLPPPPSINEPLRPVAAPPSMAHKSNAQPPKRPAQMPDMRRANSAIDAATLAQLQAANPAGTQYRSDSQTRDDSQIDSSASPQIGWRAGPAAQNQSNMTEWRLPTIPGTPAVERERFDFASQDDLKREKSNGNIQRKPVANRA